MLLSYIAVVTISVLLYRLQACYRNTQIRLVTLQYRVYPFYYQGIAKKGYKQLDSIVTEWEEVKKLDTRSFEKYMKTPIILDGRNCYDMEAFNGMKVIYDSIGRPCVNNLKKEN